MPLNNVVGENMDGGHQSKKKKKVNADAAGNDHHSQDFSPRSSRLLGEKSRL